MEFLDARRLTGPSLVLDKPGSILDVACSEKRAQELIPLWQREVGRMHAALGWDDPQFNAVPLVGGVSLAFTAPLDALYAASELNEWAYASCAHVLDGTDAPDFEQAVGALRQSAAEESNPRLLDVQRLAQDHEVTLLWDDDEASLGLGRYSETWPVRELPDPETIDWASYRDVPIGLVTGTNGKTTSVRLAMNILRQTGRSIGLSSTDWIAVNDRIMDRDDWSGPGGARAVLREKDVDLAILETARGGLLRRGLGVERADASLITNISEDHIGDFGSRNLDELLDIKWIIARVVEDAGRVVLNADDPLLVRRAGEHAGDIVWFSMDPRNTVVTEHLHNGGLAFVADGGELLKLEGNERVPICRAEDIPITMQGAALHNVANALGASALTWCLGVSLEDIRAGLASMSQGDNPGRCNIYDVGGRTVLVDFAHNPGAMKALFMMAEALPGKRRVLCFGHAGDRPDDLLQEITRDAWSIGLDRVIISELAAYHRGREHGDIYRVIRDELLRIGAREDQVEHNEVEIDSFKSALDWARQGDLIIMIALASARAVRELLDELGAVPRT
ncbi:MAG: Mur ligase family protein [Woeseiaceae bacterium]|nr:Mur ligase family protein [Woeseiaceae bacterium]